MSFFKRSVTYSLDCFARVGYKNDVKTAKKYGNILQASDCVIKYLNKNKFSVALSTVCDTFLHINVKCYFHLFGQNKILVYKVGKLIFLPPVCLNFILFK